MTENSRLVMFSSPGYGFSAGEEGDSLLAVRMPPRTLPVAVRRAYPPDVDESHHKDSYRCSLPRARDTGELPLPQRR